jgi:hypothetical protein
MLNVYLHTFLPDGRQTAEVDIGLDDNGIDYLCNACAEMTEWDGIRRAVEVTLTKEESHAS